MKRKRKFGWLPLALGLLVFAATAVWMVRAVGQTAEASDSSGLVQMASTSSSSSEEAERMNMSRTFSCQRPRK